MALSTQSLPEQLDALEQRLNKLLGVMQSLAADNQSLRDRETQLQKECDELHKKNAAASAQIATIIERLKHSTENPAENKEV